MPDSWLAQRLTEIERKQDCLNTSLRSIYALLKSILRKDIHMAKTLDDVLADVAAENTVIDSLEALTKSIAEQLKAAGGDQAKIDAIADALESKTAEIAQAVTDNTPSA